MPRIMGLALVFPLLLLLLLRPPHLETCSVLCVVDSSRFCVCVNRIVMVAVLFPFLWVWTVLGSIWFHRSGSCLADTTQYWGVLIWLIFMYICTDMTPPPSPLLQHALLVTSL